MLIPVASIVAALLVGLLIVWRLSRVHPPISWTLWAIILGAPAITALLVWQLLRLTPQQWCLPAKGTLPDCTPVILKLLDIKDHAVMGLLFVLGLTYVVLVVTHVKTRVQFTGPGGVGGSIGGGSNDG